MIVTQGFAGPPRPTGQPARLGENDTPCMAVAVECVDIGNGKRISR
jgi:hypothetical protein